MKKVLSNIIIICMLITLFNLSPLGTAIVSAADSYAWEFNTYGNLEGWTMSGFSALSIDSGRVWGQIGNSDPQMWTPSGLQINAQECSKIVMRFKVSPDAIGPIQIFWNVDNDPMSEKTSMLIDAIKDNQYHVYELNMKENAFWQGLITQVRIDPCSGPVGTTLEMDYFRIQPAGADVKCTLGRNNLTVKPATTFKVYAVIENKGDAIALAPQAVLNLPAGLNLVAGSSTINTTDIAPLEKRILSWDVSGNAGRYDIQAAISGSNIATQNLSMYTIVTGDDSSSTYRSATVPNIYTTTNGSLVLENTNNRMVFIKDSNEFVSYRTDVWNGSQWYTLSATQPFSKLYYEDSGMQEKKLFPSAYTITQLDSTTAEVRFDGSFIDTGTATWTFSMKFRMIKDSKDTTTTYKISPSIQRSIYRFEGPILRVGDTNFGKAKKDAIFPGLEWLEGNEESSAIGPDFKNNHANRVVPKYYKITTPVMAVCKDNYLVGLDWDPQQVWNSTSKVPSAQFSVPNNLEAMDNSSMGLFLPSTYDGKVRENNLLADIAYVLPASQEMTLISNIYVSGTAADGAVDALAHYNTNNTPQLLPAARTNAQTIELSRDSIMNTFWDDTKKGWTFDFINDNTMRYDVYPEAGTAAALYRFSLYTADPAVKSAARARVSDAKTALDTRYGSKSYGLELPYYIGNAKDAIKEADYNINGSARSQKADGNWPYAGDVFYGTPGSSAQGVTAAMANGILQNAVTTGSRRALESGLRGVDALNAYLVPRGAQSWEVPLHAPDVFAAALAVNANVTAYEITNSNTYKDNAVLWAKKGFPFLYTWKSDDKINAMKFMTTPLFASSWYWRSWIGEPVPWNALAYSDSLFKLAQYDSSLPWSTFAEGIYRATTYLQRTQTNANGAFPDIYFMSGDWWGAPWLNPIPLMQTAMKLEGCPYYEVSHKFAADGIRKYAIGSAGTITSAALDVNKVLTFNVTYPNGETSYSTVAGLLKPTVVKKNGIALTYFDDLSLASEGWSYSSNVSGLVEIKLSHGISPVGVSIETCTPSPDWTFSTDSDSEGWMPAGQIGSMPVAGGKLVITPNGDNPGITKTVNLQTSDYTKLVVNLKISSGKGKLLKFSWNPNGQSWDKSRSEVVGTVDDGNDKQVIFDLTKISTWTGNISDIKLEWPDTKTGEVITVDDIKLVKDVVTKNAEVEWDFNTDNEGWTAQKDIYSLSAANGSLVGQSSNNDPVIFSSDNLNNLAGAAPILQVRMKSSNAGSNQTFFSLPAPYDGFTEDRSIGLDIRGTGKFYDYATNMSNISANPNKWSMDLMGWLKQLRFDPINQLGTNFEIDYLGLLREPDQQNYGKLWSFDSTAENWTTTGGFSAPLNENGSLKATVTGANPRFLTPVTTIDTKYQYMILRMKTSGGTKATVRWAYDSQIYTPERNQNLVVNSDNNYHVYLLKLSNNTDEWAGTVKQLAIDFYDAPVNSTVNIDYVKLAEFPEYDKDWTWSNNGDPEGWVNSHSLSGFTVDEGLLSTSTTGIDPYMEGPVISTSASDAPLIRIRMAVNAGDRAEIYWRTNLSTQWDGNKRISFPVIPDGKLRTYEIYLGNHPEWKDNIIQLRVDLADSAPVGTTAKFDYIRLIADKGKYPIIWDFTRNGAYKGWSDSYNCLANPIYSSNGLTWDMNGLDPFFEGPMTDIDASKYRYLKIVMSTPSGNGTVGGLYWLKKDGTWNGNDNSSFNLIADGNLHEYIVDLKSNSNWNGFIKQLRFDPIQDPSSTSGSIVIKEISLMP